ncbi:MAG: hypothetical protein PHU67_04265 [Sulfurovum sp.]|nr:hypothetical protein [Sulfurovum sp.]MDD3499674.1 hypothetical protein [Sulfurovum sp.]
MKILTQTTLVLAAASTLFTGCSLEEALVDESMEYDSGSGSTGSDKMTLSKTGEGFLVTWTKKSGTYGEVIYTDDLNKERGNGYPLTANADGTYMMPCTLVESDSEGARFSCAPSNVSNSKSVYLKTGVSYSWLVSTGFDHTHGEVGGSTLYSGGELIVE